MFAHFIFSHDIVFIYLTINSYCVIRKYFPITFCLTFPAHQVISWKVGCKVKIHQTFNSLEVEKDKSNYISWSRNERWNSIWKKWIKANLRIGFYEDFLNNTDFEILFNYICNYTANLTNFYDICFFLSLMSRALKVSYGLLPKQ